MNVVRLLSGFRSRVNSYGFKLLNVSCCSARVPSTVLSRMCSQNGQKVIWKTTPGPSRSSFAEKVAKPPKRATRITQLPVEDVVTAGMVFIGIGFVGWYGLLCGSQLRDAFGIDGRSFLIWPQYVQERVRDTYLYFGSSLAIAVTSAVVSCKNPMILNLASKKPLLTLAMALAASIGTGLYTMSLDYVPQFNVKHVAWFLHSCLVGVVIVPVALMGGAPIISTAWCTAGAIFSFTGIAVCAYNESFLCIAGLLAVFLGSIPIAAFEPVLFPASMAVGSSLAVSAGYISLAGFLGMFFYNTYRRVEIAKTLPVDPSKPFDPINASISFYFPVSMFIAIIEKILRPGEEKNKLH